MKKSNKILAVLLALVMIITAVPMMTAMAAEEHVHTFVVGATVEADCETKASITYDCKDANCNASYTVETDALGHKPVGNYKVEDVEGASKHYKRCDVCDKKLYEDHSYEGATVTVTTAPTCEDNGVGTVKCTVCGYENKNYAIPATGHTFAEPTADENNLTHSGTCTVCKENKAENHKWDDGVVTTAPKCQAVGVMTYTCTVCKATKTEDIDATCVFTAAPKSISDDEHQYTCVAENCGGTKNEAHNFVVVAGEKSECDGSIALTITCEDCDYKYEAKASVHQFDGYSKVNKDTHEQYCINCDKTFVVAHTWITVEEKAATCVEAGFKKVECACGATNTEEYAKLEQHTWDEGEETKAATCIEDGEKTFKCTVEGCEATKVEAIEAKGEHTFGDWLVVEPATVDKEGTKARKCTVCGHTETAKIDKLDKDDLEVGDVDGNGIITAVDARMVLQQVAGILTLTEDQASRADVDGKNGITAVDARMILQIVAGV